jgi:hypothetical protein
VTGSGLDNITVYLPLALTLLKELNDAFGPPFTKPIANTIESLINMVQVIHPGIDVDS